MDFTCNFLSYHLITATDCLSTTNSFYFTGIMFIYTADLKLTVGQVILIKFLVAILLGENDV